MPIDHSWKHYKQTGNVSVDMVAACINFYHCQGRKLKVIRLSPMHWAMFKGYVLEKIPAFTVWDNEIDFDDVIVTKASILSNEPISWEFEKPQEKKVVYMTDYRKN